MRTFARSTRKNHVFALYIRSIEETAALTLTGSAGFMEFQFGCTLSGVILSKSSWGLRSAFEWGWAAGEWVVRPAVLRILGAHLPLETWIHGEPEVAQILGDLQGAAGG